jgi:hypothetical protein
MKQSEHNHNVINNFILHITHSSGDGDDNYRKPITYTAEQLYQLADEYIAEDHVDGVEADG